MTLRIFTLSFILLALFASCDFQDDDPILEDPMEEETALFGTFSYTFEGQSYDLVIRKSDIDNLMRVDLGDGTQMSRIEAIGEFNIQNGVGYHGLIIFWISSPDEDLTVGQYQSNDPACDAQIGELCASFTIPGYDAYSGTLELSEVNLENGGHLKGTYSGEVIDSPIFNGQDTVFYNITDGVFDLVIQLN